MGVFDFHDFDEDFNPLDKSEIEGLGYRSNRNAFVREIKESDDTAVFKEALDAFFLSGAIKLFRADKSPSSVSTRHHTMLVHRATSQDAHEEDRDLVTMLLADNAYRKKASMGRLWRLWQRDFSPVSGFRSPNLQGRKALLASRLFSSKRSTDSNRPENRFWSSMVVMTIGMTCRTLTRRTCGTFL